MMQGPNFEGLAEMAAATDISLVASGGVSTLEDVRKLREMGMPACIVGRAIYDGAMRLEDVLRIGQDIASSAGDIRDGDKGYVEY
jgi:phosphoribosylformimino-5-aminoimidazole carboxamide ribotide isomerase